MLIRMKTLACGPDGSYQAGKVYDVPDKQAAEWIKGSFAERVAVAPPPVQTAAAPPAPETAAATPKPEPKRKRKTEPKKVAGKE